MDNAALTRVLVALKTIAKLANGDKLNTRTSLQIVNGRSWGSAVVRYISGDNRNSTVEFAAQTVATAIVMLSHVSPQTQAQILSSLSGAKNGLVELCQTYADDAAVCSQLEVLVEQIDHTLQTRIAAV